MREIDKILLQIEEHIKSETYANVETDKFELKDLSTGGDWRELYKSACAFMNTRGGILVIGIKEDNQQKQFRFTGFQSGNENNIKQLPFQFTTDEGKKIDLTEYIRPDLVELKPFLTGQICLVFVEKLPDEEKYVFYNNDAYERRITGDHRIPDEKIQKQKELKQDLKTATELDFVPNTTIDDLDVDKLNDYIIRLNNDVKVETIKADIPSALSFLSRKKMIRDNNPTLLGMLVCGKHLFDHIGGKCEVDAYFETGHDLATDQKVLKDNIISLMESSVNYAFSKTGTGISVQKGGTTVYEYPEEVVRETANNALAHRDYKSNRFSIIRIANNQFLEIRNPGKFRQEQLMYANEPIKLRRIIPIPKAQNPNLADILKSYKRWEGRGIGMSSLTNYTLNNHIDVPYYRLYSENEIGLFIPKGKVLDENANAWLNSFNKYILQKTGGKELTLEQKTVLTYFYKSELLNALEKYTVNLTPDNNHFAAIKDLESWSLVKQLPQSTISSQVFSIDPTLTKTGFSEEMREIFGGAYDMLSNDLKNVIESIYQHNEYSTVSEVSASLIGNHLYFKKYGNKIDLKEFGNFKRKIRNSINKLEKNGYIIRKIEKKPNYNINKSFERKPSIFDNKK